jgi:Family of unknown function (DUF6463)
MRIGTMVMGIGLIHCLFGFVAFHQTWMELFDAGVLNSVGENPMRGAVAWFFLFGAPVISYGYLMRHLEIASGSLPTHVKWHLLALLALGVTLMPASGFWLLLIPLFLEFKRRSGSQSLRATET